MCACGKDTFIERETGKKKRRWDFQSHADSGKNSKIINSSGTMMVMELPKLAKPLVQTNCQGWLTPMTRGHVQYIQAQVLYRILQVKYKSFIPGGFLLCSTLNLLPPDLVKELRSLNVPVCQGLLDSC